MNERDTIRFDGHPLGRAVPDGSRIQGTLPAAADLYSDIEEMERTRFGDHVPGLLIVMLAALAAGYVSDHYNAPLTLMALLIGLALNFLNMDRRLAPGLSFASRTLLRIGIVLVGVRINLGQVTDLGPMVLIVLIGIVVLTLIAGVIAARLLGVGTAFGTLAGGAVAICGASAALALATIIGERRLGKASLTIVLVTISAMSSLAMFLYPIVAHYLGLGDRSAGFLMGASIHDVAQALGAGFSYSQAAGETAAIVKLTRVATLAVVLVIVEMFFPQDNHGRARPIVPPWFVIGFFAMVAVNSTGVIPAEVGGMLRTTTSALLVCAVMATGIQSPMNALLDCGIRPIIVIAVATGVSFLLACSAALWLM